MGVSECTRKSLELVGSRHNGLSTIGKSAPSGNCELAGSNRSGSGV